MPDEIERELAAFGRTLEARVGEAIRPGVAGGATVGHRPTRRWWAVGGAAACLVAVVAGLLLATRPPDDEPAASPAPSSSTTLAPTTTTVPTSVADVVPDDPLALVREGWTFRQRDDAPFEYDADSLPVACDEAAPIEAFDGVDRVVDVFELDSVRLSVSIVDVGSLDRGIQLADGVLGLESCFARSFEGTTVDTVALSSIRATWLRVGEEFALATIVSEGSRAIVLEVEGAPFGDDLVAELAHRADQFLRSVEVVGAPVETAVATTTTSLLDPGR